MQIQVIDHGTVVGFLGKDQEADEFLSEIEADTWMGGILWFDHRMAQNFINRITSEHEVEFVG